MVGFRLLVAALVTASGLLVAGAAPVAAQQKAQVKTPPAVIAVIDGQRIIRESAALKGARQQLEQFRLTFQSEITKDDEKLRAEDQELGRQRAVLSPEVFEQRRQAFQNKVIELQRRVQERSQSVDKMLGGVRDQVTQQVVEILREVGVERGYNMVLDRAQVQIFLGDNIDITSEVLRRLDQRLPSVKVTLPPAQ